MYAPAQHRQFSRIVATLLAIGALAACGYKGPLYMAPAKPVPQNQAQEAQTQVPAQDQARGTDTRPAESQTRQPSTTTPSRAQ
ncbi:hypothetical protein ANDA3_0174 [plant metagenome]|uniref:Lipoprotein n=1 Tax=plant metagenome TaxID=1297885 RepID=A0A484QUN5_9ZZZZ